MFKRHFVALAITLSIYYIPPMLYTVSGHAEWLNAVAWSSAYCSLIYVFAKVRVMPLLLTAECIAITTVGLAFTEHHIVQSDSFFYNNYEPILNACFIAELLTIAVGVLSGDPVKRLYRLWISLFDRDTYRNSLVLSVEKPI